MNDFFLKLNEMFTNLGLIIDQNLYIITCVYWIFSVDKSSKTKFFIFFFKIQIRCGHNFCFELVDNLVWSWCQQLWNHCSTLRFLPGNSSSHACLHSSRCKTFFFFEINYNCKYYNYYWNKSRDLTKDFYLYINIIYC